MNRLTRLKKNISFERQQVVGHSLYRRLTTAPDLRLFMQHHVFAVWDFMSLIKALQIRLTGTTLPWKPSLDATATRLINEIVLAEESDEYPSGGYASHFILYRAAMQRAKANADSIDDFMDAIFDGKSIHQSLIEAETPAFVRQFVKATFKTIQEGQTHEIAAAFTFGREELIPDVFSKLVKKLAQQHKKEFGLFGEYLKRHVELDSQYHTPRALELVSQLCGNSPAKWRQAEKAAKKALQARKMLWDGIEKNL